MQSLPASRHTERLARAISAQFASRPTLRFVIARLLENLIIDKTAALNTDINSIYVALPNNAGAYDPTLLVDVVLDYLASGDLPNLTNNIDERKPRLVDGANIKVTYAQIGDTEASTWPRMSMIESIIRELPPIVHIGFQEALTTFWNAPGVSGASRWQWLGDQLADSLHSAAIGLHAKDATISESLTQVVTHPDRQGLTKNTGIRVYTLEINLSKGALSATILPPDLLITRERRVLHCRLSGVIDAYVSVDDFVQAFQREISLEYEVDSIKLKRYEADGNFFDTQAALLLNQQLEDLAAIKLPAHTSTAELETLFARVTDPAPALQSTPVADPRSLRLVQSALPDWLVNADVVDQLAYRKHCLELATARQASQGKSWSEGIAPLRLFAAKKLHEQMLLDQPLAPGYKPDELELTFHVPVGALGSGFIEKVKMTLTDLALRNLSGKPKGRMTISHTGGQLIQDWTTPEYLLDLVNRVDIGKVYPQLIKDQLLTDSLQSRERQRLFGDELRVMLPLDTLELAVRGKQGLTRMGYRFVAALVQPEQINRVVDGNNIVIRALAFLRKTGAEPDVVQNMFVIEPADSKGPCLLYRPLYGESLQQYPDRAALLAAITAPGAIQDSVLAWLSDRARPVYDHGGFKEPHILHFSPLDPFGLPDRPKPATLASETSGSELEQFLRNGTLMQYLFGSNARLLFDLADRESVSNSESRWAIVLEGGWLLFNTLMALPLSPPVMLVGWMVSLASSLAQDIPALGSQDDTTRELGFVDLLLNIALVLLHGAQNIETDVAKPDPEGRSRLALEPVRRLSIPSGDTPPPIEPVPVGLPAEPPGGGKTLLDFDKSLARDASAARLLERLMEVRVPWPEEPVDPIQIGPFKGIFRIAHRWHASVAGLLFEVRIVPGFGEVFIIHPQKPNHPGIKLKTDGNGHWTLDRGLKLGGGGPKKRIAAYRTELASQLAPLEISKTEIKARLKVLESAESGTSTDVAKYRKVFEATRKTLAAAWKKLDATVSPDVNATQEHQLQQKLTGAARVRYEITLEQFQQRVNASRQVQRELIEILKKMHRVDNAERYEHEQIDKLIDMFQSGITLGDMLRDHLEDVTFTDRGEGLDELKARVVVELSEGEMAAYQEFSMLEKIAAGRREALIDATTQIEAVLDDMTQVSRKGAAKREEILQALTHPETFYASNLKVLSLILDRDLTFDGITRTDNPFESQLISQMKSSDLKSATSAHVDMRVSSGFSLVEQISVYENAIRYYERQDLASRLLREFAPDRIHKDYMDKFLMRLTEVRTIAEQDLASVIREIEGTKIPSAGQTSRKQKNTSKRVFKTRNKGTLIGNVRPHTSAAGEELIDILDLETGAIVSTFHEHAQEGVYVELIDAPPPSPPPARRSATAAIEAGEKLKQERLRRERMIEREVRQLDDPILREEKNPQDWYTLLEQIAVELESIIGELELVPPVTESTATAIEAFRAEARDLRNAGQRYRNNGYKKQAPTADKVLTLLRNRAVGIQPLKVREPTKAKDFFSEFAISDTVSNSVLWYAHFHYASKTATDLGYVAGHLKRADQRNLGLKAQLNQAANDKEVVRIWRSKISTEMARILFFSA